MAKKILSSAAISLALFAFALNSYAALVTCGNNPNDPNDLCTYAKLELLVGKIFDFALTYIAIPVAVAMIVWGGVQMAISAGDEGKFKRGKQIITAAAVGLVITFSAWLIVTTVLKFVGIKT